jgi:N-acetylneuraminate synthase
MTKEISIDGCLIGLDRPPYVIAELSANHNGSLQNAFEAIKEAHRCGASAIKLQTYTADTMTIDCDAPEFLIKGGLWDGFKLYDLYEWAHTPYSWHKELFDFARKVGITIFSTPFDETAVSLLEEIKTPAYKIASFENTDLPLIEAVARTGKPLIISTGMATFGEIGEAVETARSAGCDELILLHCVSSYPAPIEQANIRRVSQLAKEFDVISGLSDHTIGNTASIAAVAVGASVIEKHFILNRDDGGPDSGFSIEPTELADLCQDAFCAWKSLGSTGFDRQRAEEASVIFRRSIYFVRDLPAGSVIRKEDIRRIRPGLGLPSKDFSKILGRQLTVDVKRGTPTNWGLFR